MKNPDQLHIGLQVFAEKLEGQKISKTLPIRELDWKVLLNAVPIKSDSMNHGTLLGRKWFVVLKRLGFVQLSDSDYGHITAVGRFFVSNPHLSDTIFTRQLLKYKISSPLEKLQGLSFRPFVLLLKSLFRAHQLNFVGLTRNEIMLFILPLMSEKDDGIEVALSKIQTFRTESQGKVGKVAKRAFVNVQYKIHGHAKFSIGTLRNFADKSMRYARMSGLFTIEIEASGGRFKLAESALQAGLIEKILNDLSPILEDSDYVTALYNPDLPRLPTDNIAVLNLQINRLTENLRMLGATTPVVDSSLELSLAEKQSEARSLQMQVNLLTEQRFYREQRTEVALNDIKTLLVNIRDGTLPSGQSYAPAFLEWGLWRLLLCINDIRNPVQETRGFKVDDSIVPINHAVPNAADCTFEYDDHIVLIEATLMTNSRQVSGESEPIRRHVARAMEMNPGKNVLCLFVAKRVDMNTYDDFVQARYRLQSGLQYQTKIVPLTIQDIIDLIDSMLVQNHFLTSGGLVLFLTDLLNMTGIDNDGQKWKKRINERFKTCLTNLKTLDAPNF
jgi:hypothetical protein